MDCLMLNRIPNGHEIVQLSAGSEVWTDAPQGHILSTVKAIHEITELIAE